MASYPEGKEEIHVLMVAFAAQGHINPLLRLGKRLVSKGLRVALATTEVAKHRMIESRVSSTTNMVSGIEFLYFSDGFKPEYGRKLNLDHYMDTLGEVGPANLSNLIKSHYRGTEKKLSCIVSNPFVPWVVDVATEHEIPCAMLWIQPCSLYSIYYRFYNKVNAFPTTENPNLTVEIPGLPLLQTQDLPSFVLPSNPFGSLPRLFSGLFQNMGKHRWVLANTFFALEEESITSVDGLCPVRPVGPLIPPSLLGQDKSLDMDIEMWKPDVSCIDWLDKQEPGSVVYVSFGSIVVLSKEQAEEIAKALKNLRKAFIWVVRKADNQEGEYLLPSGFLEETREKGLVVSWSPQTQVLAHRAVGCFITHCGWNSMLETIGAGVPVIALPHWTDQPTNAKLVTDVFRIGIRLRPGGEGPVVGHEEVERCVEEVMSGPKSGEFKRRCSELKAAAREAAASGGSSDRNIQIFVDEIVGSCHN